MNTETIAKDLVQLCSAGKFQDAGEKYWADDVVSIESMGDEREAHGKAAVRAKGEWWSGKHEVHDLKVEGPYLNGDAFAVRFIMDFSDKDSGQRMNMDELAVYRVKDGKIAEERFFNAD
jgi:hypothetical protein